MRLPITKARRGSRGPAARMPRLRRQVAALVCFHATRGQPHSGGHGCEWCYPGGRLPRAWARVTELWVRMRA